MQRSIQNLSLLLVVALSPGCEDGPPWATGQEEAAVEARHDFGPTAAYARRLVFLGPGDQLPTAALFDFTSLSDSVAVRRGVRARLLTSDTWELLMDAGWEFAPMREPWRVVPGGDLKIVVNDAGEIGAVVFNGEPHVRLEPGALLGESSPDVGTRFVLRQASLSVSGEIIRGILLDSQLGRTVSPAAVPGPLAPDTTGPEADRGEENGLARDRAGRPTPIARPGAEAFLVNNSGYYAVFAPSAADEIGWVSHGGRDEIHHGVSLEPSAWAAAGEDGIEMPVQWRIGGPGTELTGEITAAATDPSPLPGLVDLTALGYILVSGWIEDGGVRRDVFGLVRHVR